MVTDIIPRYDDLAARDVVDRLETGTYTDDELREIRAYEQNDKDRITVVQKIDELLSDTEEEAADTDDDEFAKIRLGYSGYAAGYTFSSGREVKTVPLTRRVEMRIDDRTLTRVDWLPMVSDVNRIPEAKAAIRQGVYKSLASTVEQMDDRVQKGFARGENALGTSWTPLAPATIMAKGFDDPLIEHGDMRAAFETDVDNTTLEATFSNTDPKIQWHEYGSGDIPRRAVMRPAATWAENNVIEGTFTETITDELRRVTI